jgi:hypothetical protein
MKQNKNGSRGLLNGSRRRAIIIAWDCDRQ